jgi:hypothetical protein
MEGDLKQKNGRRPKKKWKTEKKMEYDLKKKWKMTSKKERKKKEKNEVEPINQNQPNWL